MGRQKLTGRQSDLGRGVCTFIDQYSCCLQFCGNFGLPPLSQSGKDPDNPYNACADWTRGYVVCPSYRLPVLFKAFKDRVMDKHSFAYLYLAVWYLAE